MDKMLNADRGSDARKKQKIDYKAEIADLLAQMRAIDEHIRQTQSETAQLRAETWVMLDRMKAELNVA